MLAELAARAVDVEHPGLLTQAENRDPAVAHQRDVAVVDE
jgi:hypothetical protein